MRSARSLGVAAAIVAAMLWGSTGTVQALLPEGRDPLAVGALRLLVGAAFLTLLAASQPQSRAAVTRLPLTGVLFAGCAIGAYNMFFFWAVSSAGVGVGTAIAIGSAPLLATAYEVLVLRLLPGRLRALGQGVAILGVAVLAFFGAEGGGSALGITLALLAGASYAAYSLATSRISGAAPSAAIAASTFCVAALVTSPALLFASTSWLAGAQAWFGVLFLGVAATGLAYALYTWALARVAASTAVTLALMEPVTAWLLATWVVGEPVTVQKLLGALLIIAGLALVAMSASGRAPVSK